jgi:thioredoxin 1
LRNYISKIYEKLKYDKLVKGRKEGLDMAGEVIEVKDATFKDEVLSATEPVLVDFWAEWCGPCRMMAPVVEQMAQAYSGKMKVAKLNVDENPESAAAYGVMSIPTLILFKGGEAVERFVGFRPKQELARLVDAKL